MIFILLMVLLLGFSCRQTYAAKIAGDSDIGKFSIEKGPDDVGILTEESSIYESQLDLDIPEDDELFAGYAYSKFYPDEKKFKA